MAARLASVGVDGAVTERSTAFYIVIAQSSPETGEEDAPRRWAVAKRFSAFVELRERIEPFLKELAPGMDQLPFPKKSWGMGTASETVEERMTLFEGWLKAVSEVVLDEGLREAGVPGVLEAYGQLCAFLEDDLSVSKETLDELGLATTQQRRLFGPVVDPESMNEMLRRELLAEEEERLPRGWQFNQPQPTEEEYAAAVPVLSEAAQRAKDGPFFRSSAPAPAPAYEDTPAAAGAAAAISEPRSARLRPEDLGGRLVDGDGNRVTVTFSAPGQIGIQYMRAKGTWSKGMSVPDRGVALVVEEIIPGSLASQHEPSLRAGLVLTKIDGVSVKGAHYEHSMRRMKGARPLKLTFEGIEGLSSSAAAAAAPADTPMSTGRTPRFGLSGGDHGSGSDSEDSNETDWESTDESEPPPAPPRIFAPGLAQQVAEAVGRCRLRGFVLCPDCDPWRLEVRALCESADTQQGFANSNALSYYAAPKSPPCEWGFNAEGDYVMVRGDVPSRVEPYLLRPTLVCKNG
jgi:hypothetical protein